MVKVWCSIFCVIILTSCGEQAQKKTGITTDTVLISNLLKINDSIYATYKKQRTPALLKTALTLFDTILTDARQYLTSKDSSVQHKTALLFLYSGHYQNLLEDYVAADSLLHTYISLKKKLNTPETNWDAHTNKVLGDIYTRFGDYQTALNYKQKSFAHYSAIQNQKEISSECINLAILYRELQQYDSALDYINRGLSVKEIAPQRKWYLLIEQARCLRLKKDPAESLLAWQKVKSFESSDTSLQNFKQYLAESKKEEAALLVLQKDFQSAVNALQKAVLISTNNTGNRLNRDVGKLYILLGEAYNLLQQSDSALFCFNQAIESVIKKDSIHKFFVPAESDLYAENTIGDALLAKANWMSSNAPASAVGAPYLSCAVNCYERINQVLFRLFASFNYDSSKLNLLAESKQRNEKAIAACERLYKITRQETWLEKAFQFAEADKAYILAEALKRNLDNTNVTGETYQKLQQAKLSYAMLERNLFQSIADNDTASINTLKSKISFADASLLALNKQWQQEHHTSSAWEEYQETDIQKIFIKLKEQNTTLIEYFTGATNNYLFILDPDKKIELLHLSDSLLQTTAQLVHFFQNRHAISNAPQQFLKTAYDCYRQTAVDKVQTTKCVIITDGLLSRLPFDALVTKLPVTKNLRNANYLVQEKIIVHEFAAKTLLTERKNKSIRDIVVFAPVYTAGRKLLPLPEQKQEVNEIKNVFDGYTIFGGVQATVSAFRNLQPVSSLHISAHAFANDSLPPRIELSDSTIYLNEIYSRQMDLSLAVLSACETGGGYVQKTEGPLSLARAFYYAGASQVISNLWKADDAVSAEILSNFYQFIRKKPVSACLNNAKKEYLSGDHPADKYSPYYWAGFTLTGLSTSSSNKYPVIIIMGILILLMTVVFRLSISKSNRIKSNRDK